MRYTGWLWELECFFCGAQFLAVMTGREAEDTQIYPCCGGDGILSRIEVRFLRVAS